MSATRLAGDFEINASADGELDREAAEALAVATTGDEAARAAAAWHQALHGQLHQVYDGLLTEPMPARTLKLLGPAASFVMPRGMRRVAAIAALAAAAACVGYLAGLQGFEGGGGDGLARLALGAHRVYASEIQHPVEVDATNAEHLAKWLGKRLGIDFAVPVIADTGFKLIGGRLLAEADTPAALLLYEDASGRRISLFIEKSASAGESSMRHAAVKGLGAYYWTDSPLACAVSGDVADAELKGIAQRIYTELAKV